MLKVLTYAVCAALVTFTALAMVPALPEAPTNVSYEKAYGTEPSQDI